MRNAIATVLIIIAAIITVTLWALSWEYDQHSESRATAQRIYEVLVAESQAAIIIADKDGTILEFNSAARNMFHLAREDAVGKDIKIILPVLGEQIDEGEIHTYTRRVGDINVIVESRWIGDTILAIISENKVLP